LARGTVPLGVLAVLPQLTVHAQQLVPGDLLISYTDGIIEQMNSGREQYGEERLAGYIQTNAHRDVQSFTRQLFEEVKEFGEGKELDDDATLLVVRNVPAEAAPPVGLVV
jgi:serine phosphatase RsbU (regulator of sigma subunit)